MRWVYRHRAKGLEPLIAAIILIAITLVIAIAVVAWMTGLFGTTLGGSEQLVVLPNATLYYNGTSSSWYLNVSVRNAGSSSSSVIAIYVANYTCFSGTQAIQPGATETFSCNTGLGSNAIISGVRYTVKVVTAAGNTFYTEVIAS